MRCPSCAHLLGLLCISGQSLYAACSPCSPSLSSWEYCCAPLMPCSVDAVHGLPLSGQATLSESPHHRVGRGVGSGGMCSDPCPLHCDRGPGGPFSSEHGVGRAAQSCLLPGPLDLRETPDLRGTDPDLVSHPRCLQPQYSSSYQVPRSARCRLYSIFVLGPRPGWRPR